jgi:D-alanyl-D-alanine carboxypeptidase/D-alanyl-D-alanine-endopeptidase (penicillin-binding protein 4)
VRRRDGRHGNGAAWRWVPVVLVLAVLAAAVAGWRYDLGPRWFGTGEPEEPSTPAAIAPPPGLELPALEPPEPVAEPAPATPTADPAKVQRVVDRFVDEKKLGRSVHVVVGNLSGGRPLVSYGADPAMPASTTKLLTSTAALEVLGPEHTFATTVVSEGRDRITLVGGGDPLLAAKPDPVLRPERADVVTLARQTAAALRAEGVRRVRLGYDASLFSGPGYSPTWPPTYRLDVVSPISALWVDEGRAPVYPGRTDDPPAYAAAAFAAALAKAGVKVQGSPQQTQAAPDAEEVARVTSPTVAEIVEHVLEVSDNEGAEVLARQTALASGEPGSFTGGAAAVTAALQGLGIRTPGLVLHDGSGLSRDDRIDPDTLVDVLRTASADDRPELRAVVTGLPVAGYTGSLAFRFADVAHPGRVRAKTGTLMHVSGLAGLATDLDGVPMAFALIADKVRSVDEWEARVILDDLAAALGACHCSR